MNTNLKSLVFLFLVSFVFSTAGAQGKNYGILTIKKEDIVKYYDNNVASFVFKYKKPLFASYKLKGTPFDADGRPVLAPFKLKKTKRHDKARLENAYKGILILYVEEMKSHGIDGTFDIYFVPLPDSDSAVAGAHYVSYLINNTPNRVIKTVGITASLQAHTASGPLDSPMRLAYTPFTLNPSPPYRTGGR